MAVYRQSNNALLQTSSTTEPRVPGVVRQIGTSVRSDDMSRMRFVAERATDESNSPSALLSIELGRRILAAARSDADQLLAEARSTTGSELSAARSRGFYEGQAAAAQELLRLSALKPKLIEQARDEIVQLVIAVAQEVLGDALREQPESITRRLERALGEQPPSDVINLVVSSEDYPFVETWYQELQARFGAELHLRLVEDPQLFSGNSRIETPLAVLESSLDAHLEAIRTHLLNTLSLQLPEELDRKCHS